jgi:predicted O-methyltransferase YrrM
MHPVPRSYDHPLRASVREYFDGYCSSSDAGEPVEAPLGDAPLPILPILERMRRVDGWFADEEAELLIATAARSFADAPASPLVVEVGSYCGRSTTALGCTAKALRPDARIFAVDPHAGEVGAAGDGLSRTAPTLESFRASMEASGLTTLVHEIVARSTDVAWNEPIDLLFIDGLHDYASVAEDFAHFAPFVISGGYVAFHDYAPYYPGVMAFVDACVARGGYRRAGLRKSLVVLRRVRESAPLR